MGGFANGSSRSSLTRAAALGCSGAGWAAGYSARMQAPGAEAIAEVCAGQQCAHACTPCVHCEVQGRVWSNGRLCCAW